MDFNRYLGHNLCHWAPLCQGEVALAGLYNPGWRELAGDRQQHCLLVAPEAVFGSQAFILSRPALRYIVKHWDEVDGLQDIKMSRLAGRLSRALFYQTPSLVQHGGAQSAWGGWYHQAGDFDPDWKAWQNVRIGEFRRRVEPAYS